MPKMTFKTLLSPEPINEHLSDETPRADRVLETWKTPSGMQFQVLNRECLYFSLMVPQSVAGSGVFSAAKEIELTQMAYELLEHVDVQNLTAQVRLPEYPRKWLEDEDMDPDWRIELAKKKFGLPSEA